MRLSEYTSGIDLTHFAPIPYADMDFRGNDYDALAYFMSRRGCEIRRGAEAPSRSRIDGGPCSPPSIGPSNRVLSSTKADLTESTYETIMENFHHQVRGMIDGKPMLLYETHQDIPRLKAAVMGGQQAMREAAWLDHLR